MKVYTTTYYKKNYGSALQAVALQKKLMELGYESVIIKPRPVEKINVSLIERIKFFLRPERHYGIIRKTRRWMQRGMLQSKYKKIELFVNENAVLQSYQSCVDEMKSNEGILLAGSDQIWSTLNHPIDELYLFNFVHDKHHKKYSYATSTGISEFSKEQLQYYANALREFEVVSFRELQVYEKLKEYLPVEQIRYDVDPTLLYDGESWSSLTAGRKIEGKYIFVYMLRPDNRLIKIARKLSKETKCKIVYMGLYVNKYAGVQTVVDAGVEDYLSYIRYADYVVTNSFHGTVFSMQFHRKFVSMKLESTSSRAENILRIAGLENRLIADIESSKIITEEIDYNCVDKKLQAERQKSVQYLQSLKFGTEL